MSSLGKRAEAQDIVCPAGNSGLYDNHSIAYCLLGYLCAYYRYYHPMEFITSFLNNAANDADIQNGTALAKQRGIEITQPKFGVSKSDYFYNSEERVIAKGLSSVKYMSKKVANELYKLAQDNTYDHFCDLLLDISNKTSLDSRQLEILIKIDFFSRFGNQRELLTIVDIFEMFKKGEAKQIKKDRIDGTQFEAIVKRHSTGKTKTGAEAKSYTLLDVMAIVRECEDLYCSMLVPDISLLVKVKNFADIMGYPGYVTGSEADRNKLYIKDVIPVRRKRDGALFAYSVATMSIGNGKESWMSVFKTRFDCEPIRPGDVIVCKRWERDRQYFRMLDYEHLIA